ncbi:M28 family peptidase [Melissospora conviva]|uniref:M28 family peptidase n=1 Tax=Melissospora conviva TaxID=3388432 RepID=UPI003C29587D
METSTPSDSSLSRRRMLTVALGGAAAAVVLPAPAWAVDDKRPGAVGKPALTTTDRMVANRVSAERALAHLKVLSEDIGPRIGGTASERAAAHYIARELEKLGYDVELQPFAVADKFTGQLASPGLPSDICWQVGASAHAALDTTVTGDVIDVGAGADADYPADAAGKIVLIDYVAGRREQHVATAIAHGAAAVIFLPVDREEPRRAPTFNPTLPGSAANPVAIPVLGVAQAQKQRLRALLAAGRLTLTVSTEAHRNLTSYNVIAETSKNKKLAGKNPVVMVTAHYDTVIGAQGANDDGSGTVLCLELARVLREVPTDATFRFALWGSEEQGLIGSRYYVRNLPQAERDRIVAVYQNDMIATSWDPATRYWLLSFDGASNAATDGVTEAARRLGYEPRISPVTQRGSSDHQSFQEVGIASANFSWRGEESPAILEPPYHTPEDTIAKNISLERLQVSLEMIGCAAYATAGKR